MTVPGRQAALFSLISTAILLSPAGKAADFVVTENVWGVPSTPGTFAWAINQANTTLGQDTILLNPAAGKEISVDGSTPVFSSFLAQITDDLTIKGNGVTLVGDPVFVSSGGVIFNKYQVSEYIPGSDVLVQEAYSFASIDTGINVYTHNLSADGLNGFLQLGANSTATVNGGQIKNSVPYGNGPRPVFEANQDSTLNLEGVHIDRVNPFFEAVGAAWAGAIQGVDATLNVVKSKMMGASTSAGSINWVGGLANVVSSVIDGGNGLGGISISEDGVMNFVNSILRIDGTGDSASTRLQAYDGGVANLSAATILADNLPIDFTGCGSDPDNYRCSGYPLRAFNEGEIHLNSSVVSLINYAINEDNNDPAYSNLPLEAASSSLPGIFSADPYSFVSPTSTQDASALKTLFSQVFLLTEGIPFALLDGSAYNQLPEGAYPSPTGPLIQGVPNATTANLLLNPIDDSVITHDVYGNPRTVNGFRDIGAVQSQQVPGPLPVLGTLAAFRWSRRLRRRLS